MKKAAIPILAILTLAVSIWSAGPSQAVSLPADEGKSLFASKCAACHGLDGSGNTAKGKEFKVRDLRSAEVQKQADAKLFEVIAKGVKKMPGYEKTLGKDKVEALVAYTRALAKK
ncbi:MAG TPA: cytochrome c [Blastocatellia bacterium]|nr:cytochrome c [Blastocatellia bacterium]